MTDGIQTISPELLAHATPAELKAYEASLIKQRALLSPLDYAVHVTEGRMKPYPHTDLLSRYAKAVIDHALYDDGIGLPAVWTPNEDDPDDGEWRHPTTGELAHNVLVVSAPPQHGKQVKDTERVWTPAGWKLHGDLKRGDQVFHPSGRPVRVVATRRDDGPTMRVEFFDGTSVDVHPNHEWTVYSRNSRRTVTISTAEMEGTYRRANYMLPHQEPLFGSATDGLPLDPYFLGAWLGDGKSSAPVICGSPEDLAHIIERCPPEYELGYFSEHKTTGVHYQGFRGLTPIFRKLNLLNNKHIPQEYLTAPIALRRDLLAGLVDTDGHWSEPGKQFVFVSASRRLADDVRLLVRSLGYRAGLVERRDSRTHRTIKSDNPCYAVTWTPHDGLGGGTIKRKVGGHFGVRRRIGVKAVYKMPDAPGQCIQVDSTDGLYLVTDALIPTHNSAIMTETVPGWYLTKYPHRRVIVTGYEADFAKDFGRANRDKIESCPEFGIFVDKTTRAADNWKLTGKDGGLVTAGSGGPITGKRADLIIIDDPVKNQDDALSESARRRNKNWWQTTVKSRMRTDTVVIVIQTRWHEDDLAGHIMATERCFSLNLPAIAFDTVDERLEPDDPDYGISIDPDTEKLDPLRRKPGEVLCAALQTKSMLLRKQESGDGGDEPGGMLWFSALYQGKPNIEGGGILAKPYRYYEVRTNHSGKPYFYIKPLVHAPDRPRREVYAEECIYFITADLAVSTKNQADYTVFTLFAWTPYNQLLVVDMLRKRMESTEHAREAEAFWKRARTLTGGAGVRFFGVEHKTFGISLVQRLRQDARIPVKSLTADNDKIARAIPVGMMIREDTFFLPKVAPWLADLEKEMSVFPNGKHDDMVDTLGYGAQESRLLPRRDLSGPLSEPEQASRAKKKRNRFHPQLGRMPGRR